MIKMIIADDEEMITNGLINLWDWSEYDIEVVGVAKDGAETLDKCLALEPDILLTDINMPYKNGIDVAKELKSQGKEVVTIIISGIKDFNYAKDAIALNAYGYLLKPIKLPELRKVICDAVTTIKDSRKKSRDIYLLKHQFRENLPVLRASFLKDILYGVYLEEAGISAKCKELDMELDKFKELQVGVVELEQIPDNFSKFEDRGLLLFSVQNIIEEISEGQCLCLPINDKQVAMVFTATKIENLKYCEAIIKAIFEYLNMTISIGMGICIFNIKDLHESFQGSLEALEYRFYAGNNIVISYEDLHHTEKRFDKDELFLLQNQMMSSLIIGHKEKCMELLAKLQNEISSSRIPKKFIESICLQLMIMIYRRVEENHEDITHEIEDKFSLLQRSSSFQSLECWIQELEVLSNTCCDAIYHKIQNKNNYIVEEIIQIIKSKYSTKLTVNEMAEYVNLTPNYVSQLFKKNKNISLNQFLTKYRIEKAKELLKESDFKIYEVADMVGFDSPYYFSTVFKKHTGYHPSMYKDL